MGILFFHAQYAIESGLLIFSPKRAIIYAVRFKKARWVGQAASVAVCGFYVPCMTPPRAHGVLHH